MTARLGFDWRYRALCEEESTIPPSLKLLLLKTDVHIEIYWLPAPLKCSGYLKKQLVPLVRPTNLTNNFPFTIIDYRAVISELVGGGVLLHLIVHDVRMFDKIGQKWPSQNLPGAP